MRKQIFVIGLVFLINGLHSQVKDVEGKTYQTEVIGTQEYMTENLSVSTFRNGDKILQAKTIGEWLMADNAGKPAWCYYENSEDNGELYGKLYNWYAVRDYRGLSPKGWHVPKGKEWKELIKSIGDKKSVGKSLKNTEGWTEDGGGDNQTGFSGLPGGLRGENGSFVGIGDTGQWWSSSTSNVYTASYIIIYGYSDKVVKSSSLFKSGKSIRCVKNIE